MTPAIAAAADRAEAAAQMARQAADSVAGQIRQRPLTAMLVAVGVGWTIGRATR